MDPESPKEGDDECGQGNNQGKVHGRQELLSATTTAGMLTKVYTDDYIQAQVLPSRP